MDFEGIFTWKKPVISGSVLGVGLALLLSSFYYSTISLLAYSGFLLLGISAATKVSIYVMKEILKWDVTDPLENFHGKKHLCHPGWA